MGVFENPGSHEDTFNTLVRPCAGAGLAQGLSTLVPDRFGTRVARGGLAQGPQDGPKKALRWPKKEEN